MRALIAVLAFAAVVPAGGQTHGKAPRTIEGRPDLQGVWTFSTITPLERPAEFAGREFITDAEAQAYEQRVAERSNRPGRGTRRRRRTFGAVFAARLRALGRRPAERRRRVIAGAFRVSA